MSTDKAAPSVLEERDGTRWGTRKSGWVGNNCMRGGFIMTQDTPQTQDKINYRTNTNGRKKKKSAKFISLSDERVVKS